MSRKNIIVSSLVKKNPILSQMSSKNTKSTQVIAVNNNIQTTSLYHKNYWKRMKK